jgi:hypothetical protein
MCYRDYNILFSKNAQYHFEHVKKVLHRLWEHRLYSKMSKCEFYRTEVYFLGHVVGATGLSMQNQKEASRQDLTTPTKLLDLQAFLGLVNYYRRFITKFLNPNSTNDGPNYGRQSRIPMG